MLYAHVVLWQYLRGKAVRAGLFVKDVGSTAVAVPTKAAEYVGRQTEALQNEVVLRVEQRLGRALDSAFEKLKGKLKDDYMPKQLKALIDDAVEEVAPDLKLAMFERADDFLWKNRPFRMRSSSAAWKLSASPLAQPMALVRGPADAASGTFNTNFNERMLFFQRVRASVLYTIAPYDKSVWQSVRNPYYLACQVTGIIPRINIVWWLFVYALHDKKDEWQLGQFIAGFQTSRFLAQGLFGTARGAFLYYMCSNTMEPTCAVNGPGLRTFFDAPMFALQICVVLHCYRLLPFATKRVKKPEEISRTRVLKAAFPHLEHLSLGEQSPGLRPSKSPRLGQGGHLANLFYWHAVVASFTILLGIGALYMHLEDDEWQLRATLHWIQVLYGLCSFPFCIFKIPVAAAVLTHCKPTGYDPRGRTVRQVRKRKAD